MHEISDYGEQLYQLFAIPAMLNILVGIVCVLYRSVLGRLGFLPNHLVVSGEIVLFLVLENDMLDRLISTTYQRFPLVHARPEVEAVVLFGWLFTIPIAICSYYLANLWFTGCLIGLTDS